MKIIKKETVIIEVSPEDLKGLPGCEWNPDEVTLTVNAIGSGELFSVYSQISSDEVCASSGNITMRGVTKDTVPDKIRLLLRSGIFPWDKLIAAFNSQQKDFSVRFTKS